MRDKILGCMVGGAVGDALGYAVEFMDREAIVRKYGEAGIRRYELDAAGVAEISDDTQMSLFTAAGCLLGLTRSCFRGIMGSLDGYCRHTYLDWYFTQTHKFGEKPESEEREFTSWLTGIPQLYSRRAPGITCLNALRSLEERVPVDNDSCGCGGVMRVAPNGLICARLGYGGQPQHDAAMAARLTHHHPLGFLPAAVLTLILMEILKNGYRTRCGLKEAIAAALAAYPETINEGAGYRTYRETWPEYVSKLSNLITRAVSLAESDVPDEEAIPQLGQGWTGHEALAIAVFCAVRHADNFESAVASAVNHSGDSDSTGAICGNIIGALLGRKAIPFWYTTDLEILDVIEDIADDLYSGCPIGEYIDIDTVDKWRWNMKYLDLHYWEPREEMEAHILDGSLFEKFGCNKDYWLDLIKDRAKEK